MKGILGSSKPLLFVVEDCKAYRVLMERLLEKKGFKVLTFEKPWDAIQELSFNTPDLFISDIELPEMTGFELYEEINTRFPEKNIPFMYISSTQSPAWQARASKIGVIDMLLKPVSSDKLYHSLDLALQHPAA